MLLRIFKTITRAFQGSPFGRKLHNESKKQLQSPLAALNSPYLQERVLNNEHCNSPIFILSAGWRSGSTLLQRMLLKGKDTIIWGEPYHRSNLIDNMLNQLVPLQGKWPPRDYFLNENTDDLSEKWIANCWPLESHLKNAHLAFWQRLFEHPANENGFKRWGLKEVRWGEKEVRYLNWLYPDAKFIYLYRNPYKAFASFYHYPRAAYLNWPKEPIFTATAFARMWLNRVDEFKKLEDENIGISLRYEDLKENITKERLEEYLGMEVLNGKSLSKTSTPGAKKTSNNNDSKHYLPKIERYLLKFLLKNKIKKYGY